MTFDIPDDQREAFNAGHSSVLAELEAFAQEEAKCGDGRALRLFERFKARLGRSRSRALHVDDGA